MEAQKLLSNLRDERVPGKLAASNIKRFTIEWAGRDGIDVQFHADYLRQFCSDFYKNITQMVRTFANVYMCKCIVMQTAPYDNQTLL